MVYLRSRWLCRAVRVSTIAGGVSHKHHKKRKCNSWADGNSTVARFNYVHGTAFQALSPAEIRLSMQNPQGSLAQPGSMGGSRYLYVRDNARSSTLHVKLMGLPRMTIATRYGEPECVMPGGRKTRMQVCDEDNNRIRRIDLGTRVTTTLAGSGNPGKYDKPPKDGFGQFAEFRYPGGIGVDEHGIVYVGDYEANRIRKVTPPSLQNINGDGGMH